MRSPRGWVYRIKFVFNRDRHEQELAEEIQANIALHIDDNVSRGMPPDEARRSALARFGIIDNAKEAVREMHGIAFAQSVIQDLRYAFVSELMSQKRFEEVICQRNYSSPRPVCPRSQNAEPVFEGFS